ncbi:MAG: 2-succinyl-5-enolpyruvyl-6-hydroxy-3-cyclohexene-1-carboxylic-acid synthase [Dermatophilaceae bacterium]
MALATVLVDELVRGGVHEVVLCPGSRSAPLAYAALEAERAGLLRLHVRVDERSAGFLALGLAKGSSGVRGRTPWAEPGSGALVAIVTTSGTAVANLHPAVLEAHHAGVPLVVLSADRPHELRGTGANQTTTQPGVFGRSTRFDTDFPAPESVPTSSGPWRSTVCRALAAARGLLDGDPGPAHLDVGFREPLVPDDGAPASAEALPAALAGRADDAPWVTVVPREAQARSVPVVDHIERTLVVVGDGVDTDAAVAWACGRGYPVVAEPFGSLGARAGALPHGPLLLTATEWLAAHLPERVVVVGRPTLARPVAALLRRPGMRVEVVSGGISWADPAHLASMVHSWSTLAADLADSRDPAGRGDWARVWADAGSRVADAVAAQGFPWPSGLAVADAIARSLPGGAALVLGSSNPARDLDLATTGRHDADPGVHVFANRGLAGIDGLVSTAVGVGLAHGRPTYALLGDLTLLHDANGLSIGPHEPRPDLTIVVVNDNGGGIFTTLEPGAPEHAASFERLFGTPTRTDIAALCRAHGIRHDLAESRERLAELAAETPTGIRVVEVRVDRSGHRAAHKALREAAARTLAG